VFVLLSQLTGTSYVMTPRIVSAEDGKHLKRLYEQHALAAMRASALLGREGMESAKFKEADKAAGRAWRQVRMILGDMNSYWT
jgi:hypothetical protein